MDDIAEKFVAYLTRESSKSSNKRDLLDAFIIASNLLSAGYMDSSIIDFMIGSLDGLSSFTDRKSYDIYSEDRSLFKGLPKVWKEAPLINPQLNIEYGYCYPLAYDLAGLSSMYKLRNNIINKKIDSVIDYLLCDEFHDKISDGYGIVCTTRGRYYSMGWDPKLPGYSHSGDFDASGVKSHSKLLFYAELASRYPLAVQSDWYRSVICHLEQFKVEKGTYCFPNEYLKEQSGYAIQGSHMGLGENRRNKAWREIESTFIMLKLKSAINKKHTISA
ncbi:MAG: hypothetical protein HGA22_00765 [Clostridiales bacterium]|nr:hypothetical protein [Clostridiales bacterium]